MTEAKSAAGLIDHVLRKHEFYSQAECADIPGTIGADLIAVVLSYAAERERLLDDLCEVIATYGRCTIPALRLEELFRITESRHKSRLSSRPATEGKRDE